MALTLSAITLNSADPRRTAAFWAEALGWSWRDGGNGYLHVLGGQVLLIVQPAADRVTGPTDVHLDLKADDPGHGVARLVAVGAEIVAERADSHGLRTVLRDPDGRSSAWREVVLLTRGRPLHRTTSRAGDDLIAWRSSRSEPRGRGRAGRMGARRVSRRRRGWLAERPKATVLKTVSAVKPYSRVRIPCPPQGRPQSGPSTKAWIAMTAAPRAHSENSIGCTSR